MAGGAGTRFWPRSRAHAPKQLLPIVGGRTMLAETIARLVPPFARRDLMVVTVRAHARAVRAAVPGLGRSAVLVEPVGRNTAAAIALAALHVARRDPRATMLVLPADHAIGDVATFRADVQAGLALAERTGALVTFGVPPTRPETGYGYIRPGRAVGGAGRRAAWVARFIEKPDRRRAETLLRQGGVLWNAGIFAFRVDAILAALGRHLPAVLAPLAAAVAGRDRRALARAYRKVPAVSIDTGVLERAERVAVVRTRFAWSDVGSWAAVEPFWRTPGNGRNAVRGRVLPIDSRGCVVDSADRLVALVGVEDLVVVDAPDAVLVCRKDRAQDVRMVVDELRRRRLVRYL
jgi:mannose-1-phosphate guanylyltransferase